MPPIRCARGRWVPRPTRARVCVRSSRAAGDRLALVTSLTSDVLGPGPWENGSLEVFDFTDPGSPAKSSQIQRYGAVAMAGDLAYVFDGEELRVLDLTVPATPTLAAALPFPHAIRAAVADGDYLYATKDEEQGAAFFVLDVSEPRAPGLAGTLAPRAGGLDLAVDGACAYLLHWEGQKIHIQIVDVGDPRQPRLAGYFDGGEYWRWPAEGLTAENGRVFVATASGGLNILAHDLPPTPLPTATRPRPTARSTATPAPTREPPVGRGFLPRTDRP